MLWGIGEDPITYKQQLPWVILISLNLRVPALETWDTGLW